MKVKLVCCNQTNSIIYCSFITKLASPLLSHTSLRLQDLTTFSIRSIQKIKPTHWHRRHCDMCINSEQVRNKLLLSLLLLLLNISQLTLAKWARSVRHQSGLQQVPGSIPTGGNIFILNLFCCTEVS